MKILVISTLLAFGISASASTNQEKKLPELNVIKTLTLEGSYSCDSKKKYGVNFAAKDQYSTDWDLFINASCGGKIVLQSGVNGMSLSVIADIGEVPLEQVTMYQGLSPKWQAGFSNEFKIRADVELNHTYSLLVNSESTSAMVIFKVLAIDRDRVTLKYAVKSYQLKLQPLESNGVNYDSPNTESPERLN